MKAKEILCVLLSATLVLNEVPITAFAQDDVESGGGAEPIVLVAEDPEEATGGEADAAIVSELPSEALQEDKDEEGSSSSEQEEPVEDDAAVSPEDSTEDHEGTVDTEATVEAEMTVEAEADATVSDENATDAGQLEPAADAVKPTISYSAHVQNVGWQADAKDGAVAGTSGRSLRVEAFKASVSGKGIPAGSIEYRSHVQNIGWTSWSKDGKLTGTTGRSLRVEALQIRLTGELANSYDLYYQAHVQNLGWLSLAKNGESCGSSGRSLRVEALRVWIVKKGDAAPKVSTSKPKAFYGDVGLTVQAHVQNVGWQSKVASGAVAGTTGRSLRVEALKLQLNAMQEAGSIEYRAHVQNEGWQGWRSDGQTAGSTGRGRRIEALQVRLTGEVAETHDVWYRVHLQNIGWLDWASNGAKAGSEGFSLRVEAVQVALVAKGAPAPSSDSAVSYAYVDVPTISYGVYVDGSGWQGAKSDGAVAGTTGKSKSILGLRAKVVADDGSTLGSVSYAVKGDGADWSSWSSDFSDAGGSSTKALTALRMKLTGELASSYDVWYRVHLSNCGWIGWARNGQDAGSDVAGSHIEAVQVKLVPKGISGPGSNAGHYVKTLSGDPYVDYYVRSTIERNGWSGMNGLRAAYDHVSAFNWIRMSHDPGSNWRGWAPSFAHVMIAQHGGNCYRYAALMYWFGKALGFDINIYPGRVSNSDHGWNEVVYKGKVYVIDTEMNCSVQYPELNWFMVTYSQARIRYYDNNMNRVMK